MQEFESISASSYDPSALAVKLTAKAGEGWSVVAIVPTGGDVTAFLSRDSGGAATPSASAGSTDTVSSTEAERAAETVAPEPAMTEPERKSEAGEPAGWAIAPEPATPSKPETTIVQPAVNIEPDPVSDHAAAPVPDSAPAPTVPAGWYADPAGRFEVRYWDGTNWTEHVSRAGQQFTDPPVA